MKNQSKICAIIIVRCAVLLLVWVSIGVCANALTHGNEEGKYQSPRLVMVGAPAFKFYFNGSTAEILCNNTNNHFEELVNSSNEKGYECQSITDVMEYIKHALNETEKLQEDKSDLEEEIKNLKNGNNDTIKHITGMEERIEELENENKIARGNNSDMAEEINKLRRNNSDMAEEIKIKIEDAELEIVKKINELRENYIDVENNLRAEISALQENITKESQNVSGETSKLNSDGFDSSQVALLGVGACTIGMIIVIIGYEGIRRRQWIAHLIFKQRYHTDKNNALQPRILYRKGNTIPSDDFSVISPTFKIDQNNASPDSDSDTD